MSWLGYVVVGIYVAIAFWAVLMGIDKMSKVIIGNYIVGITCFAFGNLIHQGVNLLMANPNLKFLGITYEKFADFLSAGQLTFVLLLFAGLIWLIYACGRIQVSYGSNLATEKLYFIILIPITVLSFIAGPYIALMAQGIQAIGVIESSITSTFGFLSTFIKHIPFWMFANGIAFIILSSRIDFKISVSAKATKLPEGL